MQLFDEVIMSILRIKEQIILFQPLDRDAPKGQPHWFLWVGVSDGKYSATARLLVNVKDVNDNPPFFAVPLVLATVKENGLESKYGFNGLFNSQ